MPGRMGGETRTMQNLYVMRVDTSLNLIFVKVGPVPPRSSLALESRSNCFYFISLTARMLSFSLLILDRIVHP